MPIKKHDFVEIEYTGKLKDGTVFDTTDEKIAKENNIHDPKAEYKPTVICIGEQQIPEGLDDFLQGKEPNQEYTVELLPEKAFGRKNAQKIKLIPLNTFKKQEIMPQPGLQVNIDNEMGTILRVSGGRVLVDFNHPLAGKEVVYTVKPLRIITDTKEKIEAFMKTSLNLPGIKTEIKDSKAVITMPLELPPQAQEPIKKKLIELAQIKEVEFKSPPKTEPKKQKTPETKEKNNSTPKPNTNSQD